MAAFSITYDLISSGQDYKAVHNKIKEYGTWCHLQDSVWIIETNSSAAEIRDNIGTVLDGNDELCVLKLSGNWATKGHSDKINNWLKENVSKTA